MSHSIVEKYSTAIVAGKIDDIAGMLSETVIMLPPGSNQPNEGKAKTSAMLSTLGIVVDDLKIVRIFDGGKDWYTILFDGSLDGTMVQFIDHVHVDNTNLIDHIDIFLRPASVAQTLLEKVTFEIKRQSSI